MELRQHDVPILRLLRIGQEPRQKYVQSIEDPVKDEGYLTSRPREALLPHILLCLLHITLQIGQFGLHRCLQQR